VWNTSDDLPNEEKNQYTERIIDKITPIYTRETQIRVVTNEGDQQIGTCSLEEWVCTLPEMLTWYKKCGNKSLDVDLSWNEFNVNVIKIDFDSSYLYIRRATS